MLVALVAIGFVVIVFGTQAWTIRRTWVRALESFAHPVPHPGPIRDDARALVDELVRLGFVAGQWQWLEPVGWGCLVLQRPDGTRSVVLSGNKPPGYDLSSELANGVVLLTQASAFTPTEPASVRQVIGGLDAAGLLAAHDRALAAVGSPPLVIRSFDEVTEAVMAWERASLQSILVHGWSTALWTSLRAMFGQQLDTSPLVDRRDDLERLRAPVP